MTQQVPQLIIIRGLQGSGKTSLLELIIRRSPVNVAGISVDDLYSLRDIKTIIEKVAKDSSYDDFIVVEGILHKRQDIEAVISMFLDVYPNGKVSLRTPGTPWEFNPLECYKKCLERNTVPVKYDSIIRIRDEWEDLT